MRKFDSPEDVQTLNEDEALEITRMARDALAEALRGDLTHEHWTDDCGDDIDAATDAWSALWNLGFRNDWSGEEWLEGVRAWLVSEDHGLDIHDELISEEWQARRWGIHSAVHNLWRATHPTEVEQIRTGKYLNKRPAGSGVMRKQRPSKATRLYDAVAALVTADVDHLPEWVMDVLRAHDLDKEVAKSL